MKLFRLILILFTIGIIAYTIYVFIHHGADLMTPFFGEMTAFTWKGQFLFDFQTYLFLSGLWLAWRECFSAKGIIFGLIAFVFGILFFAPYLLWLTYQHKEDWSKILLGNQVSL